MANEFYPLVGDGLSCGQTAARTEAAEGALHGRPGPWPAPPWAMPRKAIEYYEQALKISREIGGLAECGNSTWGYIGLAYSILGDPRKAIEYHDQALKISREIGDLRG